MKTLLYLLAVKFIPSAGAQNVWAEYYNVFGGSGSGQGFIIDLGVRSANFFLMLITGGSILAIMWGGVRMVTSAGNEEAKENAKKTVQFALLGAVLAIMAQAIIQFTANFFLEFSRL